MKSSDMITVDPGILGGTPVFKGTRVPVRTLFEYLADGLSLDYFHSYRHHHIHSALIGT